MRPLWLGLATCVLLGGLPEPVEAQARTCRQVLPSDFRRIINTRGEEIVYFRDPVRVLCTGGILLEADSAVMNRAASTVELIGTVFYRDSTREMEAEWANYIGRNEQLLARGSTVIRDLEGGSVITGGQLNYRRGTRTRETRTIITGGRPYAVLRAGGDPATPQPRDRRVDPRDILGDTPDGDVRPPGELPRPPDAPPRRPDAGEDGDEEDGPVTEVWANRMESEGGDVFVAEGDVDLKRGDMVGESDAARFDQAQERTTLTGSAYVQTPDYRLDGNTIDAFLEESQLREVHSEGAARVRADELDIRAERVRIGFAAGTVERLEAWNPDPASAPRRAIAHAQDFRLRADSIDAMADTVGIREIRAVGRAYGERDIALGVGGRASPLMVGAIERDWIQGDTIIGHFAHVPVEVDDAPDADGDDAGAELEVDAEAEAGAIDGPAVDGPAATNSDSTEVVLERIVVIGSPGPALSLYRMVPEDGVGNPAINFMKAKRIILFMERGDVARVEAEGPIEGLYLDPEGDGGGDASAGDAGRREGETP